MCFGQLEREGRRLDASGRAGRRPSPCTRTTLRCNRDVRVRLICRNAGGFAVGFLVERLGERARAWSDTITGRVEAPPGWSLVTSCSSFEETVRVVIGFPGTNYPSKPMLS